MMNRKHALCLTLLLSFAPATTAQNLAMGKMWLTENPPLEYLEKEYGFKPDANWMNRLRMASIRFGGGCSSSFVSPKGLIMTNHHCARGNIASVQGKNDWVKNGFYAASYEDEVKLPGLTVQQVVDIKDVTDKVNAGIPEDADSATIARRQRANIARITKAAAGKDLQPQVVTLFQGARFHLYIYKAWKDIRLVCSPHLQTAHFGGDPDNFTYPRYGIDFAFCRAYVDGKPADTSKHYFKWKLNGAKENELVFIPGNPGSTGRLLTKAQLEYTRDVQQPIIIDFLDAEVEARTAIAKKDPAYEKSSRTRRFSMQNSQKAYRGYQGGVEEVRLMAQKTTNEAEFQARVNKDPVLKNAYGDVWDKIARIAEEQKKVFPGLWFFGRPSRMGSPELERAIQIVGGQRVNTKKPLRVDPADDGITAKMLASAKRWLGADHEVIQELLRDGSPADAVKRLRSSKIGDAAFVKSLREEGGIAKSDDPAIRAARLIVGHRSKVSQQWGRLQTELGVQGQRIGKALFGAYGDMVSPDATLTLRFSDGRVKGYPYNGTIAPWRTTFWSMYGRATEFGNEYPFDLPKPWWDRKDKVDLSKAVNFVSTNDIIGGNSGSPVVNQNLEIVGLVFDGNIEMLPNNFLYRQDTPRSVSVHVDAIMESLTKIYDAQRIADELLGK